jgi:iron complex outermembrane receptor protein
MKHFKVVLFLAVMVAASADAQTTPKSGELTDLSVDDLLNVEVTTVARRGQKLVETTAATFVISQEDIRRSGATSIPDLLRMVPGFDVSEINSNIWAVSARGFNGRGSNKVLVLIDGRSVYSEVFFGIDWRTIDAFFEDIDRIEVTRGPGGTLWGANAINGIVNIITKHPVDTQGTVAYASHGSGEGPSVGARYGGRFGSTGHYRAYVKGFDRPQTIDSLRHGFNDNWSMMRGGFRAEWMTRLGSLNLQGDGYRGTTDETSKLPNEQFPLGQKHDDQTHLGGHNLLLRWTMTQSVRSETSLQASLDFARSDNMVTNERRRNIDVDFQHHLMLGTRNHATWGAELRSTTFVTGGPRDIIQLSRSHDTDNLFTAFIQDELTLTPQLRITAGTKVVRDPILGLQWQPSVRALWMPRPDQTVWAAVTRAVRLPSQFERFSTSEVAAFPGRDGQPVKIVLYGDRNLKAESATSYEAGYRLRPARNVSIDVTAYINSLHQFIASSVTDPTPEQKSMSILPLVFENDVSGRTKGVEALVTWRPTAQWDLSAGYASWSPAVKGDDFSDLDAPHHQAQLRSFYTVTSRLEFDAALYFTGWIPAQHVRRYLRTDARIAWQVLPSLEVSVIGRNLTDDAHTEFNGKIESGAQAPTRRTISGMVTWRY